MPYHLRETLRYCIVGDCAVFLDLESGRYSALPDPSASSFGRWAKGAELSASDLHTLGRLAEEGLLITTTTDTVTGSLAAKVAAPEAVVETVGVRPTVASLLAALIGRLMWSSRVRRWTFARLIERVGECPIAARGDESTGSISRLTRIVRSFEVVDAMFGSHDRCLVRSLALTAACRRHGLASNLIIGVRPAPFAAHSWVQQGHFILNEKPDRALLFTPILVA